MNFKEVEKKYRPIPFWSWNDKLETEETRRQVNIMNDAGIGGFFMHARGGLITEYMSEEWFDNIGAACDEANALGMYPWAYDENGWPSGFGGGRVNGLGEEYQQKTLHVEPLTEENASKPRTVLVKDGYRYYYDVNEFYVDVLDGKVTDKFIEVVHKEYQRRFGNNFAGFFTDEPQIYRVSGFPWSFTLEEEYFRAYGESLTERLDQLFFKKGDYINTRVKLWKLVTELFAKNFMKKIYDFCIENGYGFTGHMTCEENMESQLTSSGASMPHYEYFTIPGMDWLGRRVYECLTPLALGSAAAQLGKKQVLSETYALAGHNVSHGELKRIYEWQMVRGVNLLCTHLEGYSLKGIRKRDYPPAMYYQQPWWRDMNIFFDSMSRVGKILSEGEIVADTLLIHPQTTVWALYEGKETESKDAVRKEIDYYDAELRRVIRELEDKHILFHLGDEILMEKHGFVKDGKLVIGNMSYSKIIIPPHILLLDNSLRLIEEFKNQGGVVTTEREIEPSDITEPSRLTYTKRSYPDFDVHYFVNTDNAPIYATVKRGNKMLDITTGDLLPFSGSHNFAPYESLVVIDTHEEREPFAEKEKTERLDLSGQWQVDRHSLNSITLDLCDWSYDGGEINKNGCVLDILPRVNELRRPSKVYQKYTFRIEHIPEELYLCSETPELFEITVNSVPVKAEGELKWFRDKSFKLLDIKNVAITGENVVELRSTISQSQKTYEHLSNSWTFETMKNTLSYDTEIEQIYIVGSFGAYINTPCEPVGDDAYRITELPVIGKSPKVVDIKALDKGGFPQFAGEIELSRKFNIENTSKEVYLKGSGLNSIAIYVNGNYVATKMFPPYNVNISEYLKKGDNEIKLSIVNNLRNMQGPFHVNKGENINVVPAHFYREQCVFGSAKSESCHDIMGHYDERICLTYLGLD